jgi:hypothetical protein
MLVGSSSQPPAEAVTVVRATRFSAKRTTRLAERTADSVTTLPAARAESRAPPTLRRPRTSPLGGSSTSTRRRTVTTTPASMWAAVAALVDGIAI